MEELQNLECDESKEQLLQATRKKDLWEKRLPWGINNSCCQEISTVSSCSGRLIRSRWYFSSRNHVRRGTEFYSRWTAVFALLPSGFGQVSLTRSLVLWLATGSSMRLRHPPIWSPKLATLAVTNLVGFLCDYKQMVCQKASSFPTSYKHILRALHQMDTWDKSQWFKKHHIWRARIWCLQIHITISNLSPMLLLAFRLIGNSS